MEISGREQSIHSWHWTPLEDCPTWEVDKETRSNLCTIQWRFFIVLESHQVQNLLQMIHRAHTQESALGTKNSESPYAASPPWTNFQILQQFFTRTKLPNSGNNLDTWLKQSRHYSRIAKCAFVRSLLKVEQPALGRMRSL